MKYRINGFDQIKAFYSLVFENKFPVKPQHISLYVFLINQNNRNNWVEWFKCPYDLAMAGACIGNKNTYYKCLDELQEWNLIKYQKGINNWKAPLIKLEVLKCTSTDTSTDTATVPQSEPLLIQLPQQVLIHIYKPITNNLKLITDNIDVFSSKFNEIIKELKSKPEKEPLKRFTPPSFDEVKGYCVERKNNVDSEKFINHYTANGWMVGRNKMKDWKAAIRTWEKNNFSNAPQNTSDSIQLTPDQLKDMNIRNKRRRMEGKEPFTPDSYFKVFRGRNTKGLNDEGMCY